MRRWIVCASLILFVFVGTTPGWARSWRVESRALHRARSYAIPKNPAFAGILSTALPGTGQIYAGSPGKGLLFLFAEATLFTAAAIQIDRAVYYDDLADQYDLFYDEYSNDYLTYNQGYTRARGHGIAGAGLLLAGIGMHLWNIQDAVQTAQQYNRSSRFALEVRTVPEPQLAYQVRF